MDQVIKSLIAANNGVLREFVQEVIYDTLPQGEVLKRVAKEKSQCITWFDGCNTVSGMGSGVLISTSLYCPQKQPSYCVRYRCEEEEESGEHRPALICGTPYSVTVAGCSCKEEYKWRDKGSLKCVKSCP